MVATVDTVECVLCHKTHLETPAERMCRNREGIMVMGYDAHDWTYNRELYKGVYSVVCKKTHDDILAPKLTRVES
jgi:hypothetical protein